MFIIIFCIGPEEDPLPNEDISGTDENDSKDGLSNTNECVTISVTNEHGQIKQINTKYVNSN